MIHAHAELRNGLNRMVWKDNHEPAEVKQQIFLAEIMQKETTNGHEWDGEEPRRRWFGTTVY